MKGIVVVSYCVLLVIGSLFSQFCSALSLGWQDSPILTTTGSQVLDVSWIESTTTEDSRSKSDPIRQGTSRPVSNPSSDDKTVGVIIASDEDGRITTHAGAIADLMKLLQSIINWSLGVLAFVALSYLIYHGFLMVTASGDDKQFDKGKSGIKTAVIAIAGIGLAWLIVSAILWLIKLMV